jgi:signal peptidase II
MLPLALAAVLVADQILKRLVLAGSRGPALLALGPSIRIQPVLSHRSVANRSGVRTVVLWCAWSACLLMLLLVAPRAGQFGASLTQAALGAAFGGAASNLLDVLFRKGVVDYVELGAWPAFNLADVAIVSGVAVAILTR